MHFVTGATGLLGSHIAEQLVKRGERVRALVRPGSDTRFLASLGVELFSGDLADLETLRRGVAGAKVVYHSACKVGDWGAWREFCRDTLDGTRNILQASADAGVARVVHVSSISAYGHPKPRPEPITEAEPLATRFWPFWDYYTRAKVEAERIVEDFRTRTGLPITVIRPGWLYGPRDRTSIFRLARSLRLGRVWIIGDGTNRLNTVYAGNVAEACLLASAHPAAAGQAYNVCSDGPITQREYLDRFADALGLPRPRRHAPYRAVFLFAFLLEAYFRLRRQPNPPYITRYAAWLLGRNTIYSTAKAERELGWKPTVSYAEGIQRTADWYKTQAAHP
jgi:nucleoside-diphosphate-sugar epimerase